MTLSDWHRLPICTPVELKVDGETVAAGNVLQCFRGRFQILTATSHHWEDWPMLPQVLAEEPTRLSWMRLDGGAKLTLTIREESRVGHSTAPDNNPKDTHP